MADRSVKHASVVLLALCFLAACEERQAMNLDGTWKPVSAKLAGNPFPGETLETMSLFIRDDAYTATVGGQVDKGMLMVDNTRSPATMKIVGQEGPNKGTTIPAIFKVTEDTLTVCYAIGGSEPPPDFSSTADDGCFLVVYHRAG